MDSRYETVLTILYTAITTLNILAHVYSYVLHVLRWPLSEAWSRFQHCQCYHSDCLFSNKLEKEKIPHPG